ncbi:MAG: SdrD B-like domain-containing protein, partial [Chitinophagales bacterium]
DLTAGTYTVTITDANDCTTTAEATITEPTEIILEGTATHLECGLDSDGTASIIAIGGSGALTYLWSNGINTLNNEQLSLGTYTVTVTDGNNCSATGEVAITALSDCAALGDFVWLDTDGDGVYDEGEEGIEGVPLKLFDASGNQVGFTDTDENGFYRFDKLSAGSYTVSVPTFGLNAEQLSTPNHQKATLTSGQEDLTLDFGYTPEFVCTLTASATGEDLACFGDSGGDIDLTIVGGTATYTYTWSNGATTEDLSNLTAGTYIVTVVDANDCTATTEATINQPTTALTASAVFEESACAGGSDGFINLTVNGGTSDYGYVWSNGATAEDVSSVTAGTYTVTVIDANNCTTTTEITIDQDATGIAANATRENVSCFGGADGTIDLTVNGGTSDYSYAWSNGANTEDLNNLQSGTYTVTITDANDCTTTAEATISQPSTALTANATGETLGCFGDSDGNIDLNVNGGTATYSYVWSNGGTSEDLSDLTAGTYTVTITDANDCTTTAEATISQPAEALTASATGEDLACFGDADGEIDLTVNGGTDGYSYIWSNGAISEDLSNLAGGTYKVTVTDANDCTTTAEATISQPTEALTASATGEDLACFGDADGSIDLTVNGGTAEYSYTWSNGITSEDLSNLTAGIYTVTVTDANDCTAIAEATIGQPIEALTANAVFEELDCVGGNDGFINLTVNGGTVAYDYEWSNGATNEDLSNLVAGTYTVTVTDANDCTTTSEITIDQSANALVANLVTEGLACFGGVDGNIDLTVNGGTTSYTYAWSNEATTKDLSNLTAGTYTVTITDANDCTTTASATISQPSEALTASATGETLGCFGDSNGSIDLTVNGGTTSYTYAWSNGATTEDLSNLTAGTYTVTITDANDCTTTASATITATSNCGTLGNMVWLDADRNGFQDNGETGIEGVEVTLYNADNGEVIDSQLTDENGNYSFGNLSEGNYYIIFEEMSDYSISPINAGSNDEKDSDVNENGQSPTISLGIGEENLSIDAGFYLNCNIDFSSPVVSDCIFNFDAEISQATVTVTVTWTGASIGDLLTVTAASDVRNLPIGEVNGSAEFEMLVAASGSFEELKAKIGDFCSVSDLFEAPEPCIVLNSLGDYVWLDMDGDGIQDNNENGIGGVQVTLYNADSNGTIQSTTTDNNGFYLFNELPNGNYFIVFGEVEDYSTTILDAGSNDDLDSDAGVNGQTPSVSLVGGENNTSLDAGYYEPVTIGDLVWLDLNGDGVQNQDENGIGGVTVFVLNDDGNVVGTTTTSSNGFYTFDNLAPGSYTVSVAAIGPNGETPSTPTYLIGTFTSGETNTDFDFGYQPVLNSIGDFVWLDKNGNGLQDADESGIGGIGVTLFDADTDAQLEITSTNGNGFYLFDELVDGSYYVVFDDTDGFGRSDANQGVNEGRDSDADENGQSHTVDLAGGEDNSDVDAGYFEEALIGTIVWLDMDGDGIQDDGEVGLEGVSLTLFDEDGNVIGTTVSDENGLYEFTELPPGNYTVLVSILGPNGENITTPSTQNTSLLSGERDDSLNFGYQATPEPMGALGDFVWIDQNGNGVQDIGDTGIQGVEVELFDADTDESLGTITTGTLGDYLFTGLAEGNYYVVFHSPEGYVTSLQFASSDFRADSNADENGQSDVIFLSDGIQNLTIDAGIYIPAEIIGTVWLDENGNGVQDNGEGGLQGVTVVLTNADGNVLGTFTTDLNGGYVFDDLAPGTYTVIVPPALPTGEEPTTFIQMEATLASGDSNSDLDFGYWIPPVNNLGDFVWLDENANGIQDEGEPGLEDIVVSIFDANTGELVNSTLTDEEGFYWFDNLANGDYYIVLDKVSGTLEASGQNVGGDESVDSDINADLISDTVTLEEGIDYIDLDAGLYEAAQIGAFVWLDENSDGVRDLNELGLEGIPVTLLDENGDIIATTTTGSNGFYLFSELIPGQYSVMVPELGPNGETLTTPMEMSTFVSSGDYINTLDFGYESLEEDLGAIGGTVWNDLDGDGFQDFNESGIEGITVTLILPDGTILTAQTDATGGYLFPDLTEGDYEVAVGDGLEGTIITTAGIFTPSLGAADQFLIANFGFMPVEEGELLGSIEGVVWFDIDDDGDLDSFEIGIGGVTVTIYNAEGEPIRTVETDTGGYYLFEDLPEEEYTIIVDETDVPEGLVITDGSEQVIDLGGGEYYSDADFGFVVGGFGGIFEYCTGEAVTVDLCANLVEGEFLVTPGFDVLSVEGACIEYIPQVVDGNEIISLTICQEDDPEDCRQEVFILAVGCVPPNSVMDMASITPTNTTFNGVTTPTTTGYDGITVNLWSNDYDMCFLEGWTMEIVEQPENGIIHLGTDGEIEYIPNAGFEGMDELTYQICNECGSCNSTLFSIDVTLPEVECETENFNICVAPITPIEVCPQFCLDDEYEIISAHTTYNCSIQLEEHCVTYTALPLFAGDDTVEIIACTLDGMQCDTSYINITVSQNCAELNNSPIAVDDSEIVPSGSSSINISVLNNDSDPDGDQLTITSFSQPISGTLILNGDIFEYTPFDGFEGEDSFIYQVCDYQGVCAEATVTIQVKGACNDTLHFCSEPLEPLLICPEFCDLPEDDDVTISSAHTTYNCSLQLLDDGCLQYTALPLFAGEETITIIGCNSEGICDTVYAIIQVTGCEEGAGVSFDKKSDENSLVEDVELTINSVLPVPATDFITINFSMIPGDVEIRIFSMTGQEMDMQYLNTQQTQNMVRLNVTDYPVGVYVMNIQSGEKTISTKFIKR